MGRHSSMPYYEAKLTILGLEFSGKNSMQNHIHNGEGTNLIHCTKQSFTHTQSKRKAPFFSSEPLKYVLWQTCKLS